MKKIAIAFVVIVLCAMYATASAQTEPQVYVPYISGGTGIDTGTPSPTQVPTQAPTQAPTGMPTSTPVLPTVEPSATPVPTEDITPVAPTPTGTASPTATATPDVRVLSSRYDVGTNTVQDTLYVEVQNFGGAAVCQTKVTAYVFDAAGLLIGGGNTLILIDKLQPGQRGAAGIWITKPIGVIDHYTLVVEPNTCNIAFGMMTVLSHATKRDNAFLGTQVYGVVQNPTNRPTMDTKAVVTFYAPDGSIWSVHYTFTGPIDLAAGGQGTYTITTQRNDLDGLSYVVQSEAQIH